MEKPTEEQWFEELFLRLSKSKFRSKFKLRLSDTKYIDDKGMDIIESHAKDFISKRLAPSYPHNDGKQTPMKGHPVFIAQHATATCCRGCLEKWHKIAQGKELSHRQQDYVVKVILTWIEKEYNNDIKSGR